MCRSRPSANPPLLKRRPTSQVAQANFPHFRAVPSRLRLVGDATHVRHPKVIELKIGMVGGTGNISTSIVNKLLVDGHEVVNVNRGQSGSRSLKSVRTVVLVDRNDRPRFEELMQSRRSSMRLST